MAQLPTIDPEDAMIASQERIKNKLAAQTIKMKDVCDKSEKSLSEL